MDDIERLYTSLLHILGRFCSGKNLCYANASFQCLFSWRPFVDIVESGLPASPLGTTDNSGVIVLVSIKILRERAIVLRVLIADSYIYSVDGTIEPDVDVRVRDTTFVKAFVMQSAPSPEEAVSLEACAVNKVRGLLRHLKQSATSSGTADITSFMSWVFSLPNVTLSDGLMEDPHDLLVPL